MSLWDAMNEAEERDILLGESWAQKFIPRFPKAMEAFDIWRSINNKSLIIKRHYFAGFLSSMGLSVVNTDKHEYDITLNTFGRVTVLSKVTSSHYCAYESAMEYLEGVLTKPYVKIELNDRTSNIEYE